MNLFYINHNDLPTLPPTVLTIGNFDGVHLAHQAMIKTAKTLATTNGYSVAVMVFEPQPREFFDPANAPPRLNTLSEKCKKFNALGVDTVLVAKFNQAFADLTADEFVTLLQKLNIKALVVGDDFKFGKGRTGDKDYLLNNGFFVENLNSITIDNQRVSSTAIRQRLAVGDLAGAKTLLGADYAMSGEVITGNQLGRTLDFPTANIAIGRQKSPVRGIFGVAVSAMNGNIDGTGGILLPTGELFGCANIGIRPSVNGVETRLEVHLPTFNGDLYGKMLNVRFLHFLHGEVKYDGLDALKQGITNDVRALIAWQQAFFD